MAHATQKPDADEAGPASGRPDEPAAQRAGGAQHPPEPALEVAVARTGGFAGITRRWTAQPPEDEASEWISLIDRCPWDGVRSPRGSSQEQAGARTDAGAGPMPDRFVWWIRVSWTRADPREAEVPDEQLTGAWRELVDAVREWGDAVEQPERPGR